MIYAIFNAIEIGHFMDWIRKHICDMALACKALSEDPKLIPNQRELFRFAFAMAKPASSLPQSGDPRLANKIVVATCVACRNAFDHNCPGRGGWQHPCELVRLTLLDRGNQAFGRSG